MGVSFSLVRPKAKVSSIRIKVSIDGTYITLYPGKSIETCHWDKRKCFLKSYPGQSVTNRLIRSLKQLEIEILNLLDEYKNGNPRLTFLEFEEKLNLLIDNPKTKFNATKNTSIGTKESLFEFVELFIKDCETGIRLSHKRQLIKPKTLSTYKTIKSYIKKFEDKYQRKLILSEFNQRDIDKMSDFLIIDCELAMNTHGKIMTDLLQVVKYAERLKKIPPSRLIELKFDTQREETDSIYLTETEILELMAISDFQNPVEEHVRDVFVVGCFTAMRFSDYSTLVGSAIRNNRYEFVQTKTGDKVTLPIHPVVKQILEKYNYSLPEVPPNREFNKIIKIVGARLKSLQIPFIKQITYKRERIQITKMKHDFLMTHTARRSFCSNEYLRKTDPMIIMAISGHKSHKSFMRYIKVTNDQYADQMEQIWAKRT